MPKYRDRLTGEIYEKDNQGNRIASTSPTKQSKTPNIITIPDASDISPPTENGPIGNIARFLPETLTAVGGMAGGALPFPGSSLAGGAIGSMAGRGLRNISPELFGENQGDAATQIATDVLVDRIFSGIGKVASNVFPSARNANILSAARKIFPARIDKELRDNLIANPDFAVNAGQVNPLANFVENTFAAGAKADVVKGQEADILKRVSKDKLNPEYIIQSAQANAKDNIPALTKERNRLVTGYNLLSDKTTIKAQKLKEKVDASIEALEQATESKFSQNILKAAKGNPDITPLQVARQALKDPAKMRQFIATTGDRASAKQLFMNDVVEKSIKDGKFDPSVALNHINTNELVAKEAVPSNTLYQYKNFLKRAQLVGPHTENANVGLKLRYGTAGAAIAAGAANIIQGAGIGLGAKTGGTILLGGAAMNKFAKEVLLDPRNARIATGLLDADPMSKTAKIGTKAILLGLKGAQVEFMTPDGVKHPATITNDGRVKITKN